MVIPTPMLRVKKAILITKADGNGQVSAGAESAYGFENRSDTFPLHCTEDIKFLTKYSIPGPSELKIYPSENSHRTKLLEPHGRSLRAQKSRLLYVTGVVRLNRTKHFYLNFDTSSTWTNQRSVV